MLNSSIFQVFLASICEGCFLLLHIHEEGLPDFLGCGVLVQFQEPRNVYRAAYCPTAQCASCHMLGNGVFVAGTKFSPLLNDVSFAFAVFVKFFAATTIMRANVRNWKWR